MNGRFIKASRLKKSEHIFGYLLLNIEIPHLWLPMGK